MQMLVENLTQWLPKGEKFTVKALKAIAFAQQQAGLSGRSQVEAEHILYGLLQDSTTTAARLLTESGMSLATTTQDVPETRNTPKINKFSPASQYILELALQSARLKQKKYIETEHLLLGLVQLAQTGDEHLADLLQQYEVDLMTLNQKLTEVI